MVRQKKLPPNLTEFRQALSDAALKFLQTYESIMKTALAGSNKPHNMSPEDQILISGAVVCVLIAEARPTRACDLTSVTRDMSKELQEKKRLLLPPKKESCTQAVSFLSIEANQEKLGKCISLQRDLVAPFLKLGGKGVTKKSIDPLDLEFAHNILNLSATEFFDLKLNQGEPTKRGRDVRWKYIWSSDNTWKTPKLTLMQLQRAYYAHPKYNPYIFVDRTGRPMGDLGKTFRLCVKYWTGYDMTLTLFRKCVETNAENKTLSAFALDHTVNTQQKYYQLPDLNQAITQWNSVYSLNKSVDKQIEIHNTHKAKDTVDSEDTDEQFYQHVKALTVRNRVDWKQIKALYYPQASTEKLRQRKRRLDAKGFTGSQNLKCIDN